MTRAPRPLPPSLADEIVASAEALRRGAAPDRLRRSDAHHPFHGVVSFGQRPRATVDRAWAYTQVMHADAWFSNTTAAALRGLPVPRALERGPLHVTVPTHARAPRGAGVVGHQRNIAAPACETLLVRSSRAELLPLRVATIGATLLTSATQLSLADMVALVDAARQVDDEGALGDIYRMLERSSRRAGSANLRRAVARSRAGVRSRPESHLRLLLASAGFPDPEVAPAIATPVGTLHPDLAWPQYHVLVEYEGDDHRTDARTFALDIERFDAFGDVDWATVRCTSRDLYAQPRRVLESLARRLRARGWRPSRPPRLSIPPVAVP